MCTLLIFYARRLLKMEVKKEPVLVIHSLHCELHKGDTVCLNPREKCNLSSIFLVFVFGKLYNRKTSHSGWRDGKTMAES